MICLKFRFPGESDIDQLFQIVRILGKLSSRHQILIMRNAMYRGMKQEQNSSLIQMFPNWNRDSIDFLSQCLKMDSSARPDTAKLLKHELFLRDNFLDNFLSELRTKLVQEMQVNPLLKRIPSYGSNKRWNNNNDVKKAAAISHHTTDGGASGNSMKSTTNSLSSSQMKSSGDEKKKIETKSNSKINLSVLSTQLLQPVAIKSSQQPSTNNPTNNESLNLNSNSTNAHQQNSRTNYANNEPNNMVNINDDSTTDLAANRRNSDESTKTTAQKQRNSNNIDDSSNNLNETANNKQTSVNNSTMTTMMMTTTTTTTATAQPFKDMNKYPRVLSAKLHSKTNDKNYHPNGITHNSNHFDFQFEPPSPIPPFQSLQTEITQLPSTELVATLLPNKRLSPAVSYMPANGLILTTNNSNINNSFLLGGQQSLPQYFNFRRHSNVLGVGDQSTNILLPKQGAQQFMNKPSLAMNSLHFNTRNGAAGAMIKRERDRDRSQNLIEATLKPLNSSNFQNSVLNGTSHVADGSSQNASKEPSPRLLPPPQWLTGNLKMTSIHGKNTQIGAATNAINVNGNSKRRITDWKSVGLANNTATGPKQFTDNNNSSNIDFVLPNCPGATVSPKKSSNIHSTSNNNLKKKLSSLSNVTQHHHHHHHPDLNQHALITPVSSNNLYSPFRSIQ